MKYFLTIAFLLMLAKFCAADQNTTNSSLEKNRKVFSRSIFNVVSFPNNGCAGTNSRNGTCYTSSECAAKSGSNQGTCANGYGVCCVFILGCGSTSSQNCTYLVLGSTNTPTSCKYTICPCNSNICRMRLDFNTFNINPPVLGQTNANPTPVNTPLIGGAIGTCATDSFTVSAPGNKGSPVICGFNTGQHMYVEMSAACNEESFSFGGGNFARSYDIKITQYACGDTNAGPNDCLQYFTTSTGTVQSYNFQLSNGLVTSTATHLANQCYSICFRRNAGNCALCFTPTILAGAATAINQASFGLSSPLDTNQPTAPVGYVDSFCISDYLVIPNGQQLVTNALNGFVGVSIANGGTNRVCGRFFSTLSLDPANETICTGRLPFRIIFKTDAAEIMYAGATAKAYLDETAGAPGGIIGFSLTYWQAACTTTIG